MAQRAQIAFLHGVFGIGAVAEQIARQGVDVVEMRQRGVAETPRRVMVIAACRYPPSCRPRLSRRAARHQSSRSIEHHCAALLPVAASTTTVPVMCGCREQKYSYVPGVVNVNENLSSVSSAFDLKSLLRRGDRVRDVVVVDPGHGGAGLHGDALRSEGEVVDLSPRVSAACADAAGRTAAAANTATASAVATRMMACECCHDPARPASALAAAGR